ncbi:hypothetical protein C7B62_05520 [Pleurocapsa sp. CCALA 161]|uniref:PPC domain-containing protein n=1 Tax=Pleurocapsa sp. CCALA 161 TaxID=2107688 RepID=UPI000D06A0D3|nr:PPC domain-containing protein [Pleurocapsa sp. CCALA 161]PSB11474.1 hypothetical protein C7B62_05520 [Pleurocapsa sp. CCALA 161]
MGKTKMIKVYFPGWQLWTFSISINLLVLAIQPRYILAQTNTNPDNTQTAANTANTTIADLEPEILSEINRVRTSPQDYAQWLEQQRKYYDGIWLRLPGEKPVRTNRGREALEEAIAALKQQQPLPALDKSSQTVAAATAELENFANSNNIQYFSYGKKTASGIVMDLVVDELFPDRRRRQSLLSPEAEDTGVACKPDPRYAKVCAIAYSNSVHPDYPQNPDVAEVPPEASATPDQTVAEVPPVTASQPEPNPQAAPPGVNNEPQPSPEANANSEDEPVEAEETPAAETNNEASLPVPPQPQATPPAVNNEPQPSLEANANSEDEPVEAEETPAAETNNEASLPVPPQPQATPPGVNNEPQPSPEAKPNPEDLQIAQAESEIEQEQKKIAENEQESETSATEESNQSEEVAINTETADFTEKVEEGTLAEGDRVIDDDGSLYDFYPIQGQAGESLTINLESDEFDAFVALVDSNGKTVGENDDISAEDSNSQLSVTLPEDGIYNVIVNTYDENGTGKYVLKVSR